MTQTRRGRGRQSTDAPSVTFRCRCPEGRIFKNGEWVAAPPVHDCYYIEVRNAQIGAAVREANGRAGGNEGAWRREYFAAMDRLTRAALKSEAL